jgi:hypothetical protein
MTHGQGKKMLEARLTHAHPPHRSSKEAPQLQEKVTDKSLYITVTNEQYLRVMRETAQRFPIGLDVMPLRWTIHRAARPGDTCVLYVKAPVSSVVAVAEVMTRPERCTEAGDPFYGLFYAEVSNLMMLDSWLSRATIILQIPAWGYLKAPRTTSVRVPKDAAPRLMELIEGRFFSDELNKQVRAIADKWREAFEEMKRRGD